MDGGYALNGAFSEGFLVTNHRVRMVRQEKEHDSVITWIICVSLSNLYSAYITKILNLNTLNY